MQKVGSTQCMRLLPWLALMTAENQSFGSKIEERKRGKKKKKKKIIWANDWLEIPWKEKRIKKLGAEKDKLEKGKRRKIEGQKCAFQSILNENV